MSSFDHNIIVIESLVIFFRCSFPTLLVTIRVGSAASHCRQCRELDNQARAREDFTLYRAMLRNIRKSEERFQDKSHIVFLLQEPDLRYLVENIWGGQSSLSAVRDVFELTLSRWEKKEHWLPWNCILLTKDEAKAHSKLEDIEQVRFMCVLYYSKKFSRDPYYIFCKI